MFVGFDEEDDAPLYDTEKSAIERAEMLKRWYPSIKILKHRKWVPLRFAHLVRETWFERLAYKYIETKEN